MNACAINQREFGRLLIEDQRKIGTSQHDSLSAIAEQLPANPIED